MNEKAPVYFDISTEIETIIEQVHNYSFVDGSPFAIQVETARNNDGKKWSPQLTPYEPWDVRLRDEAGAEGDLYTVGVLSMGISDEERESLIRQAAGLLCANEDSSRDRRDDAGFAGNGCAYNDEHSDVDGASPAAACEGIMTVCRESDGYAVVGVDLKAFAARTGRRHGLVVALPARIGSVPVVRIAPDAFSRRLVQGVGVRLLVVPDSVRTIASRAFSALAVEQVHVGCGVEDAGDQPCDFSALSPRIERRVYSVAVGNARYQANRGSLYDRNGVRLLFCAPPYESDMQLPADVEEIGSWAWCAGTPVPEAVHAGPCLMRVQDKRWDESVWVVDDDARARSALRARGVRCASRRAIRQDSCWFDFDEEGAVLVAGPSAPDTPSRSFARSAAERAGLSDAAQALRPAGEAKRDGSVLALPARVGDAPLVRIAPDALPWVPETLVVPSSVRSIDARNFCRGAKRASLPEGLVRIGAHCFCSRMLEGPVSIPASVRSVGVGSFEYAICRLEHTGTIVHVPADQLLSCFIGETDAGCDEEPVDGIPFNFERYDEVLRSGKNVPDRLSALLHRLASPYRLSDECRSSFVAVLRADAKAVMQRVAVEGDCAMVAALADAGFIDDSVFDEQIELLRRCNRIDCVAFLMERRHQNAAPRKAADRFSL